METPSLTYNWAISTVHIHISAFGRLLSIDGIHDGGNGVSFLS